MKLPMVYRQYSPRILIAIAAVALVVCSVPVFGTRFLNDMQYYALFADKILLGGTLYRDALDTKPPFVFLHYAIVFRLFGADNMTAVKVVTIAWLGGSALAIVALRRALSSFPSSPVLGAPLFILASFSGWGEEFLSSNTEILANLFILIGVWLLVARDFDRRPSRLLLGGACIGIACLYRNQSGAALLAYGTTMVIRSRQFDRKAKRLLFVGAGAALPTLFVVAYYARLGALADLRLLLTYQAHYLGDADDVHNFYWLRIVGRILLTVAGLWPVLLLGLWQGGAILRKWAGASRNELFQLFFAAWSVITFFMGARLYPHYFIQAIPGLTLLAAARLDALEHFGPSRPRLQRWFETHSLAIMITVAAAFTAINGGYYWTRKDKLPSQDLLAFIDAHSVPSDQVLLWVWRPQVLIEAKRAFATRLLVTTGLVGRVDPVSRPGVPRTRRHGLAELWPTFLRDLSAARPRLIIDDLPGQFDWTIDRYPQLATVLADYHACHPIDDLCIYVRKESSLGAPP